MHNIYRIQSIFIYICIYVLVSKYYLHVLLKQDYLYLIYLGSRCCSDMFLISLYVVAIFFEAAEDGSRWRGKLSHTSRSSHARVVCCHQVLFPLGQTNRGERREAGLGRKKGQPIGSASVTLTGRVRFKSENNMETIRRLWRGGYDL